jgi:Mg/Co/Ni transporter MgtE
MEQMLNVLSELPNIKGNAGFETLKAFDDNEKMNLIMELMDEKLVNMFVTPKDIDESIQFMAEIVAYSINLLFSLSRR